MSTAIRWFTLDDTPKLRAVRDAIIAGLQRDRTASAPELPLVAEGVLFDPSSLSGVRQFLRDYCHAGHRIVLGTTADSELGNRDIADLLSAGVDEFFEFSAGTFEAETERLSRLLEGWVRTDQRVAEVLASKSLIGQSSAWKNAIRQIVEVALGPSKSILIHGETGTGKEAVARLIHDLGTQRDGPYVTVDCASSIDNLFGSELFGHRKGAFTGAIQDQCGAVARAHGGTLFLDELGELRPAMQAVLLRVAQERSYTPLGATECRRSEFRLVAATHRDLERMIEAGEFRRDLFHRISMDTCKLPPLRARREDIPLLVRAFLARCGQPEINVHPRVDQWLQELPWSGNVRELQGVVHAALSRLNGANEVRLSHLPRSLLDTGTIEASQQPTRAMSLKEAVQQEVLGGKPLNDILDITRDEAVRSAVELCGGKSSEAAIRLGVSERMIQLRRRSWVHSVSVSSEGPAQGIQPEESVEAG